MTAREPSANDVLWPRDNPDYRYRIYARAPDGDLTVLACAPDAGGVGQAIVTLDNDARAVGGRLTDHGSIGVLDVQGDPVGGRGTWVFAPGFSRARVVAEQPA